MLGYIISEREKINVEEYEIQSFDVLNKTNLNIFVVENNKVLYKNDIIKNASENGHVEILEWFKNSGYEFNYDEDAINKASENGHVEILEWFKNSSYEFNYDEDAINKASKNGHIEILEWFKNSGYEFKYNNISSLNIDVLEWFKNYGYKFKNNIDLIDRAALFGDIEVLEWLKKNNYPIKPNFNIIRTAASQNQIKILDWLKKNNYKIIYNKYTLIPAGEDNLVEVFEWFKLYYTLKYDYFIIRTSSAYGRYKILNFFKNINIKKVIKFSHYTIFEITLKFKTKNNYIKGYNKN
jgi:hypothetical protein